ncbi:MAG: hypothetical protein Q4D77_00975 [Peptostreptococcaceae bacterium]|nr:hypothetical protein [Peptostreptococcaceae bacterium]
MEPNRKEHPLSASILNVNGRILMPLTDVQKALTELGLQAEVRWEHEKKEVIIQEIK